MTTYYCVWALSDESLLAGLGAGDPAAATAFVRRFQRRVYGLALMILGDPSAAEDASQETFVRAWRHAGAYDPRRGAVGTWLLTIARNASVDAARMRRSEPVDPRLALAMIEPDSDGSGEQVDAHVAADEAARVRAALRGLPEEQKRALVLAAFYGYTAREIAALEGVPLGTAKTRIRAALAKLRARLRAVHGEP